MISYRRHVVALVAVFLALAVGVALGAGPLSAPAPDARPVSARVEQRASGQPPAAYPDSFAGAVAPQLYAGRLRDRAVAIVTAPGADPGQVGGLRDQVEAAGGTVAGTYELGASLTDPTDKALVDTLGSRLVEELSPGAVGRGTTYVRAGELVSLAVRGRAAPADVAAVRAALAGGDLLTSPEKAGRATLVLLVLGEPTDPAILSGLVAGLSAGPASGSTPARPTGVVVAGDSASAEADGDLAVLRADPAARAATTVDGIESVAGRVSAVLALVRATATPGGAFGASGSDGSIPLT